MSACPKCGNEVMQGVRYCNKCGFDIGTYIAQTPLSQMTPQMQQVAQAQQVAQPQQAFQPQQVFQPEQAFQPQQTTKTQQITPIQQVPQTQVSSVGTPAQSKKKFNVLSTILAVVCIVLVIGMALGAVLFISYRKSVDGQISDLKGELSKAQSDCEDWKNKLADKEAAYNEKVTSYDALNKEYQTLNDGWNELYNTITSLNCYNNAITFESNVYTVKAGEKIWIKGEWTYNVYDDVYLGTSTSNLISVEWENNGSTPYVVATGIEPGVAVVKLGTDEYFTSDPMGFVVIVY